MLKVMKVLLGVVLFAAPLLAQDQAEAARMAAGCGANEIQYTVKTDKKQHPTAQPEQGKALVYVFSDESIDNATLHIGGATTRWGLTAHGSARMTGSPTFIFQPIRVSIASAPAGSRGSSR